MNIEIDDVNQIVLDANAHYMMSDEFEKDKADTIVEVMAATLHLSNDKARTLLSKRIKEIQAEQISEVLETLKTSKQKKKEAEKDKEVKEVSIQQESVNFGNTDDMSSEDTKNN